MAAVHFFWLALLLVAGGKNLFNRRKLSGIWIRPTYGTRTIGMAVVYYWSKQVSQPPLSQMLTDLDSDGQNTILKTVFLFRKYRIVCYFYFKTVSQNNPLGCSNITLGSAVRLGCASDRPCHDRRTVRLAAARHRRLYSGPFSVRADETSYALHSDPHHPHD